jgi:uncharacterized membrane protein
MIREEYYRKQLTEEGRREIITSLANLIHNDGWKILKIVLEDEVSSLQQRINDIDNPVTGEDLQKDRVRLYYVRWLLNYPETLALSLDSTTEDKVIKEVY